MSKTVYVLVNEWNLSDVSGGEGCKVRVFDNLASAQQAMNGDAEKWAAEEDDYYITDKGNMSIEIYEEWNYSFNHMSWSIQETEIEQDPEQLND